MTMSAVAKITFFSQFKFNWHQHASNRIIYNIIYFDNIVFFQNVVKMSCIVALQTKTGRLFLLICVYWVCRCEIFRSIMCIHLFSLLCQINMCTVHANQHKSRHHHSSSGFSIYTCF